MMLSDPNFLHKHLDRFLVFGILMVYLLIAVLNRYSDQLMDHKKPNNEKYI